jgi:hypothetical protein
MMYFERSTRQEILAHLDFMQGKLKAQASLYYDAFMRGVTGKVRLHYPECRGNVDPITAAQRKGVRVNHER